MEAYDPYSDPEVDGAMREQMGSKYKMEIVLGALGFLLFGGIAYATARGKVTLIAVFCVGVFLHGVVRLIQIRVFRAPLRSLRDSDLSLMASGRVAFAATPNGPPIIEVDWKAAGPKDDPPQDLRVRYLGTEVVGQDYSEATLENGLAIEMPDGKTLFVRLEPDFWRHRRALASLDQQDLFELRRWTRR